MNLFGTEKILKWDGTPVHYWLAGAETQPMIVLAHGGQMEHGMFARQVDVLAKSYRVLTFDMPGHGLSQPLGGELTYRGLGDLLLALMNQAGAERAVLLGHSMGACAAQEAVFYHPERVRALILADCPRVTAALIPSVEESTKMISEGIKDAPEEQVKMWMCGAAPAFSITPAVQERICQNTLGMSKATFQAINRMVLSSFHVEPGYCLLCPTLMVHGEQDMPALQEQLHAWAQEEPQSRYAVIPNAGHDIFEDNPDACNALLLDFLRKIE